MNEMGNTMTAATARSNVVPMATSTSTTTSTTTKIRVVSYNILSSHLANPQSYPTYPPQYLNKQYRLEQVLQKLEQEMNHYKSSLSQSQSKHLMNTTTNSSNDTTSSSQEEDRSTIFCLQEVSYEWAGALHTFFANHQYHVITGLYGKSFNGYMGILTAYPIQPFHTVHVDICRLSDTYPHPWPKSSSNNKYRSLSLIDQATKYIKQTFQYLQILPKDIPEPECHWNSAQRRYNVLLSVILAERNNTDNASTATTSSNTITTESSSSSSLPIPIPSNQFVISNYHMPCVYYDEKVMVLHSDLCLSRVQQMAQYEGDIPSNINHNNNNDFAIESTSPEPPPIEPIVSQQNRMVDEKEKGTTTPDDTTTTINASPLPSSEPPKKKKLRIRRPYILAGDFNIKPNDTAYQLLTTGKIDINDPAYPTPPKDYIMSPSTTNPKNDNDTTITTTTTTVWKPLQIEPVRSAYAVQASKVLCDPSSNHHNDNPTKEMTNDNDDNKPHPVTTKEYHSSGTGEPDFTNYSQMGGPEKPPFIDTLDYIFVSPNHDNDNNDDETTAVEDNRSKYDNRHCSHKITVQNVLSLSHRDDIVDGPYPNAVEPSDHVMIAADLDITFTTKAK